MKNRAELEKFILDRLSEIRDEYVDYISQFPEISMMWENEEHHLGMTIFKDNSCATGLVTSWVHEDNKRYNTYTVDASSLYPIKYRAKSFVDEMSEEELRKELSYGKDNTEE